MLNKTHSTLKNAAQAPEMLFLCIHSPTCNSTTIKRSFFSSIYRSQLIKIQIEFTVTVLLVAFLLILACLLYLVNSMYI